MHATRNGDGATFEQQPETATRYAFLGVRSCELHAMGVLDRVLLGGEHPDPRERTRLEDPFIVAVQCGQAGGTCFCVSMGTGPRAEAGFDLSLTEVLDDDGHRFVVQPGTARGAAIVARLPTRGAAPDDLAGAAGATERAIAQQGRTLDTTDIRDLLQRNLEHPRWDEVADRCLSCGNCTMVCPTCFCTSVEDTTDLAGESGRARAALGLVLHRRLLPHPRRLDPAHHPRALPPVDDAQALDLVRPVRLLGLRRLRALHHLVPGGHRHHRGSRGDSRDGRRPCRRLTS